MIWWQSTITKPVFCGNDGETFDAKVSLFYFRTVLEETDKKRETEIVKLSFSYLRLMGLENFEDYSEKYFSDILEKLHNEVAKIGKETFVERFMIFFANEIEMAINNRDAKQMEQLFYEWWWMWEDYIWYKA